MKFWNMIPDSEEPEDGVLDVDGEIIAEDGWFVPEGACIAKNFREALKGYRNVTVHINSPGGDVLAGAEIYSALREHSLNGQGRVKVIVTALAASAASIVAMAGDEILMHPVAYMMIHNPWTVAVGDAKEMRKAAKTLDEISRGLIKAYQIRTGKSEDELKRMLDNETWMSAATCIEEGFADGMYGAEEEVAASISRPMMMSLKDHGVNEILQRMRNRAEADDEDPEEDEEEEKEEKPERDPEEEEEKKPERDPEEEEEKKPERDPEEDPEEDPEKPGKAGRPAASEKQAREEMIARARMIADAYDSWMAAEESMARACAGYIITE